VLESLNKSPLLAGNRSFNLRSTLGLVEVAPGMAPQEAISAASRAARDARRLHQDMIIYGQDSNVLQEHAEELRLFEELEGGSSRALYLENAAYRCLASPHGQPELRGLAARARLLWPAHPYRPHHRSSRRKRHHHHHR